MRDWAPSLLLSFVGARVDSARSSAGTTGGDCWRGDVVVCWLLLAYVATCFLLVLLDTVDSSEHATSTSKALEISITKQLTNIY